MNKNNILYPVLVTLAVLVLLYLAFKQKIVKQMVVELTKPAVINDIIVKAGQTPGSWLFNNKNFMQR